MWFLAAPIFTIRWTWVTSMARWKAFKMTNWNFWYTAIPIACNSIEQVRKRTNLFFASVVKIVRYRLDGAHGICIGKCYEWHCHLGRLQKYIKLLVQSKRTRDCSVYWSLFGWNNNTIETRYRQGGIDWAFAWCSHCWLCWSQFEW